MVIDRFRPLRIGQRGSPFQMVFMAYIFSVGCSSGGNHLAVGDISKGPRSTMGRKEGARGTHMCHGQKSRFFWDGRPPTFNRNHYNGYINPYYWVDDHPLLYMEIMGV